MLQTEPCLIPASSHRITIVVSNSRFIATVDYAGSQEAARQIIATLRNEMPDATHHVYAFRVGHGNSVIEGMSDAGEPSGTAGTPVMTVLRGSRLGDVVMVVSRYFGGIKLGKGGLVRAYTEVAQLCLGTLSIGHKVSFKTIGFDLDYPQYETVRHLIAHYEGIVEEEIFLEKVSIIAKIPAEKTDSFGNELSNTTSGTVQPVFF